MRERQFVADMVKETYVPKMFRVKQIFSRPKIEPEEIPEIIRKLLNDEKFASRVKPGMRIAITAGSRGIANVALTTKCIADFVKSRGAYPFVVPWEVMVGQRQKVKKRFWQVMELQKIIWSAQLFLLWKLKR